MSDTVQVPNIIVGRVWLDLPRVAYHKSGGRLHLYEAESCDGETEVAADVFGSEADYLHVVEVDALPVKEPLCVVDFRYVDPELTIDDEKGLLELVNEYRECFAKNLNELGYTSLMTVDINTSPVLLVKQNCKGELCVDYRRLNKQTLCQHYPLPDMTEQLKVTGILFVQLDLVSGYLKIPLTP